MRPATGRDCLIIASCAILAVAVLSEASAEGRNDRGSRIKIPEIGRSLILDGSAIHNVGNLHVNVTNWGILGSMPKSTYPMADLPSAQWPAGSGVEYLYAMGLWVAAIKNGVPVVSTAYPENEFFPTHDPRDVIYKTYEGDPHGGRYPGSPVNDDADTLLDEDWLNGYDDDGDGLVDEDYAAHGNQMFSCRYVDNESRANLLWPEHTPMNIHVRQETFQWGEKEYEDFIGVRYFITNMGPDALIDVYVGLYADVDAGPRTFGSYHMDDLVGFCFDKRCGFDDKEQWPYWVSVGYVHDNDGDGGRTPGYFGIVALDTLYEVSGTFKIFRGMQPFINGGEPENDWQRYLAMTSQETDVDADMPNDYKILMSLGPYPGLGPAPIDETIDRVLDPGETIEVSFALVCGGSLDEMLDAAVRATMAYEGTWVNRDGKSYTGRNGLESPVAGPIIIKISECCKSCLPIVVNAGDTIYVDLDCRWQNRRVDDMMCPRAGFDRYSMRTGLDGKEHHVNWTVRTAPTPPNMRAVAGDHAVTLLWDNLSETIPDLMSGRDDFEGYQIWRADGWHRPIGTSEGTGPDHSLWSMIAIRDLVNGLMPDEDFSLPPSLGGWLYEPLTGMRYREELIADFVDYLLANPDDTVPCPPELDEAECDTLEGIARFNLDLPRGKRYYSFTDPNAKNGMPYFYAIAPYDHRIRSGDPYAIGLECSPSANFVFIQPRSQAQNPEDFEEKDVYVVPNPVTTDRMEPWTLGPNDRDQTGLKCEFRNLPRCHNIIRIYTVSGDLVQVLRHDGREGSGTMPWNLTSRNGQEIASGVYLYAVEPEDGRFQDVIGKFVVIR